MQVLFSTPTEQDVLDLVANMRHQDVAECYAAGHEDLHEVVRDGIRCSVLCWAARTDEGAMVAIFGCAPGGSLFGDFGVPWMLGTPEVPRIRRTLARVAGPYIKQMLELYPHLMNFVHAENTIAVHWLQRIGFRLHAPQPLGPQGALFHEFEMSR